MPDKVYRLTQNPEWLKEALPKAEHLIAKSADGSFYCQTHRQDAIKCAALAKSDDVVWRNTMDGGKYIATVVRLAPYRGYLTLTRDDKSVLAEEVGIAYDAPFGPDMEDIYIWQGLCTTAADRDYATRGEKAPE